MHALFGGVSEQRKAAKHRFDDARALFDRKRWRGAMYLGGYSVECLLKTKLMRRHDCHNLRELEETLQGARLLAADTTIYTHQLELLLRLAQGIDRLRQNQSLWRLFNIVNLWMPAWRYNPDLSSREDAEDFLESVEKVSHWIESNT
jgi:HEPN domain-containing protein